MCFWKRKKNHWITGGISLPITFTDIPNNQPRGYDCPSLLVLLITSHLPPTPVLNPSHPHHSALLLSILCTTLVSPPLLLYLHLWCHCPFLSCHPAPMCPLPLIRSLSHCGLHKSVPAAFFLIHIQSHCTSIFFFSPARCSGQLTYGSPFTSETQGIPWTHRPDSHPRQEQPIDTDADALHSAVEQWGQGVKGERSQATDQKHKLRLQGFRKREGLRDSEKLSGRSVSVTDDGQGIEDDDFTRKAEAGEGEPGWVWIADERWICMRLSPCLRLRLYMCVCLHTWLHTRQHTGSHAWMCALRSHPHTPTQIYITHTVSEHMCAYSNLSSMQSKGRRAEKLA